MVKLIPLSQLLHPLLQDQDEEGISAIVAPNSKEKRRKKKKENPVPVVLQVNALELLTGALCGISNNSCVYHCFYSVHVMKLSDTHASRHGVVVRNWSLESNVSPALEWIRHILPTSPWPAGVG